MTHPNHLPLRELFVSDDAAAALRADAARLPVWTLQGEQAGELGLLMTGGMAPLRGYMSQAEWRAVADGQGGAWPVPLALRVTAPFAAQVQPGQDIALDDGGGVLAVMSVTDHWAEGEGVLLGGKVKGLRRPGTDLAPNRLRSLFRERGVDRVLAIQPDDAAQVGPAARLAARMGAVLLVQPAPGLTVDAPAGAVLSPLAVTPPQGAGAVLWRGLVARNHGATHVVLGGDPRERDLYRRHQDGIGAQMVAAEEMF